MNPAVGVGETSEFAIAAMQSNSFDRHSLGLAISLPFHQGRVWVNLWTTTLLPLIIISNLIPVDIFSFSLMKYVSVWNLVKRMLINWAEQCTKFLESIAEIHVNIDATSWLLLRHSLQMMFFTWVKSFTLNLKSFPGCKISYFLGADVVDAFRARKRGCRFSRRLLTDCLHHILRVDNKRSSTAIFKLRNTTIKKITAIELQRFNWSGNWSFCFCSHTAASDCFLTWTLSSKVVCVGFVFLLN